jgi:hypothetical protein
MEATKIAESPRWTTITHKKADIIFARYREHLGGLWKMESINLNFATDL